MAIEHVLYDQHDTAAQVAADREADAADREAIIEASISHGSASIVPRVAVRAVTQGENPTKGADTVSSTQRLDLLSTVDPDWRIDDETRETGKRGLAKARAALAEARARAELRTPST